MKDVTPKSYTIKIGTSDFEKMVTESTLFVDKTLLIEELLKDGSEVNLITRPRRWGKTLNMTMVQYFFSIPVREDGSVNEEERAKRYDIFSQLKIGERPDILQDHLGQYPTIFISFKDIKTTTVEELKGKLGNLIQSLYLNHIYLRESSKLNDVNKLIFQSYLKRDLEEGDLEESLKFLSMSLFKHFGKKIVLLIDEYDTPLNDWYAQKLSQDNVVSAQENSYFQETLNMFRGLLGSALKDNPYLEKGIITGILRVAKANLFSGLNNLSEDSVLESTYAPHFGFTEEDVNALLEKAPISENPQIFEDMKSWYNGYNIGGVTIYNPWSIMNCLHNKGNLRAYWVGTASTTLLEQALILDEFQEEVQTLIEGGTVEMTADPKMVFADIKSSANALYNLLLFSGYLTVESSKQAIDGISYRCRVKIPNREIKGLFLTSIMNWVERKFKTDSQSYRSFITSLLSGEIIKFVEKLKSYLEASASYFDSGEKNSELLYNGFMWGLFASSLDEDYWVEKERESGDGRADLIIIPKPSSVYKIAFILEYKIAKKEENLEDIAERALTQIEAKRYDSKLKSYPSLKKIIKLGFAFRGKEVEVASSF